MLADLFSSTLVKFGTLFMSTSLLPGRSAILSDGLSLIEKPENIVSAWAVICPMCCDPGSSA
jgi:hypothetical protein